jgi:antitoxin ParD1/3/4
MLHMVTGNISLPHDMKAFIADETAKRGFGTVSEYLRAIIRDVQERQAERERLDELLIQGVESGPATPLTAHDWAEIRREGSRRVAERRCEPK